MGVAFRKDVFRQPQETAGMNKVIGIGLLLCVVFGTTFVQGQNRRVVFPQIAAGDSFSTELQLTNKGADTFRGSLAVLDNNGFYMPVEINGADVTSLYDLVIEPDSILILGLSREGIVQPGHVIIWDSTPEGRTNLDDHVSGTAIYRWRSESELIDSVGVPQGEGHEHFFFVVEESKGVSTGLAISNIYESTVTLLLKAFSQNGSLVDTYSLALRDFEHEAIFINEIMDLPTGFIGTIEVQSDDIVYPLALRLDGSQFSTIEVNPLPAIYDFTIILEDGSTFRGRMRIVVSGGSLTGQLHFTNPEASPDRPSLITGTAGRGYLFATTEYDNGDNSALVELLVPGGFSTSSGTTSGEALFRSDLATQSGIFTATKRN